MKRGGHVSEYDEEGGACFEVEDSRSEKNEEKNEEKDEEKYEEKYEEILPMCTHVLS
jgi:hypothetical protein